MKERTDIITMHGNPLTLLGQPVAVGEQAPDAMVLANDLSPVKLSDFHGKVLIIATVPSLDTAVCDLETRRFNQEAAKLGDDIRILTISTDLPFAQKRWCGAAGVEHVQTLSDHRETAFGLAYGILIKELRLLARAIFILDRAGTIRYIELVTEQATEPNYDAVLTVARELV
jgi:thiol peroxidase